MKYVIRNYKYEFDSIIRSRYFTPGTLIIALLETTARMSNVEGMYLCNTLVIQTLNVAVVVTTSERSRCRDRFISSCMRYAEITVVLLAPRCFIACMDIPNSIRRGNSYDSAQYPARPTHMHIESEMHILHRTITPLSYFFSL